MPQKWIVHADVGCHNMVLVNGCLMVIDFEGFSIDGEETTSGYEWFNYRRSAPEISQRTDIFAYGCAVYEIMTGNPPRRELATLPDRRRLAEQRYADYQFPEVTNLPLGELMKGYWHGNFNSMSEVLEALEMPS